MSDFFAYLAANDAKLWRLTIEHLELALSAVCVGLLVGVPLGVVIARYRRLVDPILGVANALQTVPALALIGFMMIIFGLGRSTGIAVLFVYTLMPIIRATYVGITSVDAAMIEAARGMGMTRRQMLWRVELPLALSILLAGIRVATVIAIGTASIMSLAGAGGLGFEIFAGIARVNDNMILGGALLAAGLAIAADRLIGFIERRFTSPGLRSEQEALR